MTTIYEFWQKVRKVRDNLPAEVYLTSLDKPEHGGVEAGRTCSATRDVAAQCIVRGTHREATSDEIEAFHAEQQRQSAHFAAETHRMKQQYALPPEIVDLIKATAAAPPAGTRKVKE